MTIGFRGLLRLIFFWCFAMSVATTASAAPDLELGRYLGTECLTCHRSATATSQIPNIFGVEPATLIQLLKAYRAKELANPVMQTIAGRLKDDEIEALAAYFATLKRGARP